MAMQYREQAAPNISQEQYTYSQDQQNYGDYGGRQQQIQSNQNQVFGHYSGNQDQDSQMDESYSRGNQQIVQQAKVYQYDKVAGMQIGKGWLLEKGGKQTTGHKYRENVLHAMFQAREKYIKRRKEQGATIAASMMKSANEMQHQNLRTVHPEIPDFSMKKKMSKIGGACVPKMYERFFTVDEDNFSYFVGKEIKTPKKSLLIKGSEAFIQTKTEFSSIRPGDKKTTGHEPWSQPNDFFRVGIRFKDRPAGPIYYYTQDIHEAKFLFVNIRLHGDQYKKNTISKKIQLLQNIDRVTRFQKIIQLMSFAKEKRFVQMNQFQLLSLQMTEIAQQSKKFQAKTLTRWLSNMLDDEEEVVKIRSAFRTKPPEQSSLNRRKNFNEITINKDIKALKTFVQRRKLNRQHLISQEINRQLYEESTGISVQSLILTEFDIDRQEDKRILDIKNNQAALMFDNEQSYKYMTIENKQLKSNNNKRQGQPLDLIRKLNLGDVSFISTDLHQNNQFDFNNRIHPQKDYTIRIYGPIRQMSSNFNLYAQSEQILPCQLGMDCLKMSSPSYILQIRKITFPAYLSSQENKKITLNIKVFQYKNQKQNSQRFISTSKAFHLKNVRTGELFGDGEQFNLNKLSGQDASDEFFAIGVVIRSNKKPIPRVMEKYMSNQLEINSSDGPKPTFFSYDKLSQEQRVTLQDRNDPNYKFTVSFALNQVDSRSEFNHQVIERTGKRLLIGRYVLRGDRPCYVRSINGQGKIKVVDIFTKQDFSMSVDQVKLIETAGVNILQLGEKEPQQLQMAQYDWQLQIKTSDKRLLNQIVSKIQIRQTYLQNQQQDTFTRDDLSTIQGNLIVSVLEAKGLILPQEMNRSNIDKSKQIDPVVEVRLETTQNQILKKFSSQPITNKRQVVFGTYQNKIVADQEQEFQVDLGMLNHSGKLIDKSNEQNNYDSQNSLYKKESEKYIHFLVRDNNSGQDIGSARIIIDELIDTSLFDLAKELCVGLDRQQIIKEMMDSGKYPKDIQLYTHFSGIIKFQTLFQPTADTCLRFQKLRETQHFKSPKQLLHFEHLLEKNAFDDFRFKIPQVFFDPNDKNMGQNEIDLQNLIDQTNSKPQLQQFFQRLKKNIDEDQMSIAKQTAQGNQKVSEELFKQLDSSIKFQSPFEQQYIMLKLQRKERPLVEPIFYQLKNVWDIHIQDLKNQAYNQLTYTEWRSFFNQYEIEERLAKEPGQDRVFDYEPLDDRSAIDQSDDLTQKSFMQEQRREATQNVNYLMRKSTLHADLQDKIEDGQPSSKKQKRDYSLIPTLLWEKEQKQQFTDLFNLIKAGIPSILRPFVWSELLCAKIYEKQQKRVIIKNPDKFPKKLMSKQSLFNYYLDISLKYDCNSFRQIDQDILDFKFPQSYYEETSADKSLFKQPLQMGGDANKEFKLSRQNKMKQDKQKMRKLMRILVVWGKAFQHQSTDYQFCYSTGFLKFIHRIINIMTLEDAFLIIISMMRQNPRLFCLDNSSMLGDGKSHYRFEMGTFRAILEANFPSVARKLQELGISVESLVYESITSLYSDLFHSETLFRIWDQIIFYMVTDIDLPRSDTTETQRRAIWQIFAPAIFIISQKRDQILAARTTEEVFIAYRDGSGISYNPNKVIQEIYELIDEIFITQGQRKVILKDPKQKSQTAQSGTTTATGSLVEVSGDQVKGSGILNGLFSGFMQTQTAPKKVDEVRRGLHSKLKLMHNSQRARNTIVNQFLYLIPFTDGDKQAEIGEASMAFPAKRNKDLGEDDSEIEASRIIKYQPQHVLDYRKWRTKIMPSLTQQLLGRPGIIDDDLYEFEEADVFTKKDLDIKVIHCYLHDLDHFYGNQDGDMNFRIQIQYGQRKKGGKFDVKHFTAQDDEQARKDSDQLHYYWHFKYSPGFNMIKVKMMTLDFKSISKCYIDLHGLPKGQFIHFKKPMNSPEITQNGESKFSMTQLKMSILIQKHKDKIDQHQYFSAVDPQSQQIFQYSMKKYPPSFVNIYKMSLEQKYQNKMAQALEDSVNFDFKNLERVLQNSDLAYENLNKKYNFINMMPEYRFGHLNEEMFHEFLKTCFISQYESFSSSDRNQLFRKLLEGDNQKDGKQDIKPQRKGEEANSVADMYSRWANLNVDSEETNIVNLKEKLTEQNNFTARAFLFNALYQSPVTVKEKLDILYDMTNQSNRNVDGIDMHDALMIFDTTLKQHLYYIPYNELRTEVERVFNEGKISMILGAYWTKKNAGSIKFDMSRNEKAGYCTLETFMSRGYFDSADAFQIIDVTAEVQTSVQSFISMYATKSIDFNDDISPFKSLNSILSGQGNFDIGTELIKRTSKHANYRLCLISQLVGGERHLTQLHFDAQGKLVLDKSKQPDESQEFKKYFQRNINVLDLHVRQTSLTKQEFMQGAMKIPFFGDLLRAETFWQDRKNLTQQREMGRQKQTSLRVKQKCQPIVLVFMSDKDNIFIFKFEKVTVPKTHTTYIVELSKNVYMFELQALNLEDIILDMRDRITNELLKVEQRGYINIKGRDINFKFSDNFIQEVDGKMEFFVRKVKINTNKQQNLDGAILQKHQLDDEYIWNWAPLNDFDRMEKFANLEDYQDEVFQDQVIFKLINTSGEDAADIEEYQDDKPKYIQEGYDCFSIYKHHDDSYEWRLCKIIKTELKPEFKFNAIQAFQQLGEAKMRNKNVESDVYQNGQGKMIQDQEKYWYFIEFEHLKEYGEEMWFKRRREDIIFSSRYSRDQPDFESICFQFILNAYKQ